MSEEHATDPEAMDAAPPEPTPNSSSTPAGAPSASPMAGSQFARSSSFNSSFNSGPGMRQMRRPDTPRRLKNGIRLRRKEGVDLLAWPADMWSQLLLDGVSEASKTEGLDYARAGQTATLQISPASKRACKAVRRVRTPCTSRLNNSLRTIGIV